MEVRANQWDFVVKVKYGDTLKRFSAYVHGDVVDLNMSRLRKKIINLFKLTPEAELVLTYVDQDGDNVALDDDDELHDAAIKQQLNPLRINVQLKSDTSGAPDLKWENASSASAVPQKEHNQQPDIPLVIDEALRFLPEPFRSSFSEISGDLISKATSAPAIIDLFSKIALSDGSQSANKSGAPGEARTQPKDHNVSDEPRVSDTSSPVSTQLSDQGPKQLPQQHESANGMRIDVDKTPTSVDLNTNKAHVPIFQQAAGYPSVDLLSSVWVGNEIPDLQKQSGSVDCKGKAVVSSPPVLPPAPIIEQNQPFNPSPIPTPTYGFSVMIPGNKQIPHGAAPSGVLDVNLRGWKLDTDLPFPNVWNPFSHPYQRDDFSSNGNILRTFHRGIICDGCGMRPIVGPRFRSTVKEDYDLCNVCFSEMGNERDYFRIDIAHPLRHRARHNDITIQHSGRQYPSPRGCGRPSRSKLESLFIKDVTVLDGTLIPPSTPFTKIWRMRNNGSTPWSYGTRLVWVGGDQLGNRDSVLVEIPADGFPANEEVDIAVDFISPALPGRYFSYWRLLSPSGQKFGQRVWVLIQVDDNPRENSAGGFNANLNLNLPPESSNRDGFRMIDVNAEPFDDPAPEDTLHNNSGELVKPADNQIPKDGAVPATNDGIAEAMPRPSGNQIPKDDAVPATNVGITEPMPGVALPTSYSIIYLGPSEKSSPIVPPYTPVSEELSMEDKMLKELEEMGFKQIDLNKEVLRQNKYDFDQSLDELCGYSEWDPLLQELEEMGFFDRAKNKELLMKHNGSIKRVVLDLVTGVRD